MQHVWGMACHSTSRERRVRACAPHICILYSTRRLVYFTPHEDPGCPTTSKIRDLIIPNVQPHFLNAKTSRHASLVGLSALCGQVGHRTTKPKSRSLRVHAARNCVAGARRGSVTAGSPKQSDAHMRGGPGTSQGWPGGLFARREQLLCTSSLELRAHGALPTAGSGDLGVAR